ncbi:MAG: DUF1292 domain-containing protein [Bacillota bacterium]
MAKEDLVVLQDDEGKEISFKILFDALFVGETQYVVLMPVDEEESMEPEIVILRVDAGEDGKDVLATIDSDDEWEEVLKAFEELDLEDQLGDYDFVVDEGDQEDEEEEPEI